MSDPDESSLDAVLAEIDTTKPHTARIYDYFLGGKDNFAADREVAEQAIAAWPGILVAARENRAFISRAVRYLALEAGVDQFLDVGSGLPTVSNVHEVAQSVIPSARVVYVDNDPIVHAHARALLASSPEGRCAYIQADLRSPEQIVGHPVVRELLDFSRPVGLILTAVLHFLSPEDEPERIIKTLTDALPSGSYLIASLATTEYMPTQSSAAVTRAYQRGGVGVYTRDREGFERFAFDGFELVPPGAVVSSQWRPESDPESRPSPADVATNAAVGRKR